MKCSVFILGRTHCVLWKFNTISLIHLIRRFQLTFNIIAYNSVQVKFKLIYIVHFVRVCPLLKEYSKLTLLLKFWRSREALNLLHNNFLFFFFFFFTCITKIMQELQAEMKNYVELLQQLKDFDENLAYEKQVRAQEMQEKKRLEVHKTHLLIH